MSDTLINIPSTLSTSATLLTATACTSACDKVCTATCTASCTSFCESTCMVQCTASCTDTCTSACTTSCQVSCMNCVDCGMSCLTTCQVTTQESYITNVYYYDSDGSTLLNSERFASTKSGTMTVVFSYEPEKTGYTFVCWSSDELGDVYTGEFVSVPVPAELNFIANYSGLYIHNGSEWKAAIPYVHDGSEWKAAKAYIYKDGWKSVKS